MNEAQVRTALYGQGGRPQVPHYQQAQLELIDALRAALTPDELRGYLKGQVFKYLWRERHKGTPAADLEKAAVYLGWLREFTT